MVDAASLVAFLGNSPSGDFLEEDSMNTLEVAGAMGTVAGGGAASVVEVDEMIERVVDTDQSKFSKSLRLQEGCVPPADVPPSAPKLNSTYVAHPFDFLFPLSS